MRRSLTTALLALGLLPSCRQERESYEHSKEHVDGHDHHREGHGHGDTPMNRVTKWSNDFELFAEIPPLQSGKLAKILAHVTVLSDFSPLAAGRLTLHATGPETFTAISEEPLRSGIFELAFTPGAPGTYSAELRVEGPSSGSIGGIELVVAAAGEQASSKHGESEHAESEHAEHGDDDGHGEHSAEKADDDGVIELLKEQQWGVPFATAFAVEGSLVAGIEVSGSVTTPPNGFAEVGAPIAGRIVSPPKGLPRPGSPVAKGALLATLSPAPSSPEGAARAQLAVVEAEARAAAAKAALGRAQRLIADEAISQRELEDAQREVTVAEQAIRSAREASRLFTGASGGTSSGSWRLVAPIGGTLTTVEAKPGASVSPGEVLFRIVDQSELWIRARVPEQDVARVRTDQDAQYRVTGLDEHRPIRLTGDEPGASLVTVSKVVDPVSRTVDVIYALHTEDPALRVGGLLSVHLPTGEASHGILVPRTAMVRDRGQELVYVQRDGEHFEERNVKTGASNGDRVIVLSGLSVGERIVVKGAHLVKLARSAGAEQPHGHIH